MSDQPEALRLADELVAPVGTQSTYSVMQQAAAAEQAEAERDALRAALRAMVGVYGNDYHPTAQEALRKARAALKEAK